MAASFADLEATLRDFHRDAPEPAKCRCDHAEREHDRFDPQDPRGFCNILGCDCMGFERELMGPVGAASLPMGAILGAGALAASMLVGRR